MREAANSGGVARGRGGTIQRIGAYLDAKSRTFVLGIAFVLVLLMGVGDYVSGYELFWSLFYVPPILFATWFSGKTDGLLISVLSALVATATDLMEGAKFSSLFVPWWNGTVTLAVYAVLVVVTDRLRMAYREMEDRVRKRTVALVHEIAERERLEKEMLGISDREQRRIGHDLHDTVCQHLTGAALAAQVLQEKLAARAVPEVSDAGQVTDLIEEGIRMTRDLARGLAPVDMRAEGLVVALRELGAGAAARRETAFRFALDDSVLIDDPVRVIQIYRIAQEAVANALHHAQATEIRIVLAREKGRIRLAVEDNGIGLPRDFGAHTGMGIRIMEHRAGMIGADFEIARNAQGGTTVECFLSDSAGVLNGGMAVIA